MAVRQVSEKTDDGMAVDGNGIMPIPGAQSLRTIDLFDYCPGYARSQGLCGADTSDLCHVTYGTLATSPTTAPTKCFRVIVFKGGTGAKGIYRFPEPNEEDALATVLGRFSGLTAWDVEEVAKVLREHVPW